MALDVTLEQTEFAGAMKVRFATVDVSSYSGGGEDFTPNDMGMHRFQKIVVDVEGGSGFTAQYNSDTGSIMLFGDLSGDGTGDGSAVELSEAPANTSVTLSVMALGR